MNQSAAAVNQKEETKYKYNEGTTKLPSWLGESLTQFDLYALDHCMILF